MQSPALANLGNIVAFASHDLTGIGSDLVKTRDLSRVYGVPCKSDSSGTSQ